MSQVSREEVENKIIAQVEKIKDANKLESMSATYDFIINHWYMFDPYWLQMVMYLRDGGKIH